MALKKRWLALGVLACAAAYSSYNFKEDRMLVRTMIAHSAKGDVRKTLEMMEAKRFLTNPLINVYFQMKRRQYRARFVRCDEEFEPISSNPRIHAVVDLYREYWNRKLLRAEPDAERTFLRAMSSLVGEPRAAGEEWTVDPDPEAVFGAVVELVESEGLHAASFFLNGTYGLKIWQEQSVEEYHIELPDGEVDVEVVLIRDYLLRGLSDYATLGHYGDGGWVASDQRVYCNAGEYDFDSERFRISFLKHEGLHYVDIQRYPNLSAPDLEYRAKVVELMHCTDAHIYRALEKFIRNASDDDRAFSHAYANHHLIQRLSRELFDVEFMEDLNRWRSVSYQRLNSAATELYVESRRRLERDPAAREII